MRPVVLRASDPSGLGWRLMPEALSRVYRFCERYDRYVRPDVLQRNVAQNFTADVCSVFVVAILNAEEQMVGHMLVSIEPWTGRRFMVILQLEIDDDHHITPETYKAGIAILRNVGAEIGADYVQTMAYSERGLTDLRRARLFRRLGFEPVGMTMRLPLVTVPGDADKPAEPAAEAKLEPDAGTSQGSNTLQ